MRRTIKTVTIHIAAEKWIGTMQSAYEIWVQNLEGSGMEQAIKMLVLSLPLLIFAGVIVTGCIRTARKNEREQKLKRDQKEVAQYMEIP